MKRLTDPRIASGEAPYNHPSLSLPLGDGTEVVLRASDSVEAMEDTEAMGPGLSYQTN